jgi:hypothetical protein
MYIRQAKQFLRNVDSAFDERRFGFGSLVDLMRACQREGLFRIERDRQGVMRLFPGNVMQIVDEPLDDRTPDEQDDERVAAEATSEPEPDYAPADANAVEESGWRAAPADTDVVDGSVVQEIESSPVIDVDQDDAQPAASEDQAPAAARTRGRTRRRSSGESRSRKSAEGGSTSAPRARKTASRSRTTRTKTPA